MHYYNDNDPYAAQWLENLIAAAVRRGRQEYWETIGERVLNGDPRAPRPRGILRVRGR